MATVNPPPPPPCVRACVHPPRRVPFKMKEEIKQELSEMEQQGIITPVREGKPTAWVNSLVYHRKPSGKIPVCLDPKDLNKAMLRDHHVTPTLEDILPLFKDAKYFSIVDAKSGYWNVELDEESSYLTTFNSPFGWYRFFRMLFGLKMSQVVFQSKIDQLMVGCVGTTGIADDMIVYAETEEEHDRRLLWLMRRCAEKGLNLNPEKCNIKQQEIKFYGVICRNDGVKPNPKKVTALKQMSVPRNRQELLSFLGLPTYMSMFVHNLSGLSTILRELIRITSLSNGPMNTRKLSKQSRKLSQLKLRSTTSTRRSPWPAMQCHVQKTRTGLAWFKSCCLTLFYLIILYREA